MSKLIIIEQSECTGCRQCELVCSVKHTGTANPARARINSVKWEAEGFYLPMLCQQCLVGLRSFCRLPNHHPSLLPEILSPIPI